MLSSVAENEIYEVFKTFRRYKCDAFSVNTGYNFSILSKTRKGNYTYN